MFDLLKAEWLIWSQRMRGFDSLGPVGKQHTMVRVYGRGSCSAPGNKEVRDKKRLGSQQPVPGHYPNKLMQKSYHFSKRSSLESNSLFHGFVGMFRILSTMDTP